MAPDWNRLMEEYDGHATKLVGDVDCTAEGKPLCDANGVRGYPTLKYGDPSDLQDYQGARDFDSLKKHVEDNVVPLCSPANLDLCDDEKKAEIEKFAAMSNDELQGLIDVESAKIDKAEADFKTGVEGLQAKYEQMQKDKEAAIKAVKDAGLGLMKSVLKSKK